jgi:hypothetical protein
MTTALSPRLNSLFEPVYRPGLGSQKRVRVGVVGYGYWGSKHVRVLAGLPDVQVTVIESRPDRLRRCHRDPSRKPRPSRATGVAGRPAHPG